MTDNFYLVKGLMNFSDPDKFYLVQIFKRRKDNPEMKKDMIILDNFFISTEDQFDNLKYTIEKICRDNNARAYLRLNRRSFKQIALKTLGRIAKMIEDENYEHVKRAYLSCAGEFHKEENKTWLVDIDRNGLSDSDFDSYIQRIKGEVILLVKETERNPTVYEIPSKNGIHLVCPPFNSSKFKKGFPEVDLHRDNPIVLYSN